MTSTTSAIPIFARAAYAPAVPGAAFALRGPLRRGDLDQLAAGPGPETSQACIIDTVAGPEGEPLLDEYLRAMARGVRLWGGAGTGALRAFELRDHGMQGFGHVYRSLAAGEFDADAEVFSTADAAAPDGRRVATASVRIACRHAVAAGRLSPLVARAAIERAAASPVLLHQRLRWLWRELGSPELDRILDRLQRFDDDPQCRDVRRFTARVATERRAV